MNLENLINKITATITGRLNLLDIVEDEGRKVYPGTPTYEVDDLQPHKKLYWGLVSDEDLIFYLDQEDRVHFVLYTKKEEKVTARVLEICKAFNIPCKLFSPEHIT